MIYGSVFFSLAAAAVQVENDEDEGRDDGSESAEEVGVGHKEETLELIVFVGSDGDSFCLFDEVESWFLVVDLVLVDSFL